VRTSLVTVADITSLVDPREREKQREREKREKRERRERREREREHERERERQFHRVVDISSSRKKNAREGAVLYHTHERDIPKTWAR